MLLQILCFFFHDFSLFLFTAVKFMSFKSLLFDSIFDWKQVTKTLHHCFNRCLCFRFIREFDSMSDFGAKQTFSTTTATIGFHWKNAELLKIIQSDSVLHLKKSVDSSRHFNGACFDERANHAQRAFDMRFFRLCSEHSTTWHLRNCYLDY